MRQCAALLLVAGCFSPTFNNDKTPCQSNSDCPPDFHCAANKTCWHNGADPVIDMAMSVDEDGGPGVDLAGADLVGVQRHQGELCGPNDTCDTGNCVDGYCCDKPCSNTCQACNVPGSLGTCTNVPAGGATVGTRSCNAEAASTCGRDGKCDGSGNCRDWPSGTVCLAGTCTTSTGDFTNPSTCNGTGTCVTNGGGNCAPYKCQDATQCFSSCTTGDNTHCSGANVCVNNSCGQLPNGRLCGTNGAQCQTGNCVDGYCCNSTCTNACQACDVGGSLGMCTTVPAGAPHGTRTCTNQGMTPCGGTCDGNNGMCSYGSNGSPCGTSCTSTQLVKSFCDGNGSCNPQSPANCSGNYACVGTACLGTCNGDGDCATSYGCMMGSTMCMPFCSLDDSKLDECISK